MHGGREKGCCARGLHKPEEGLNACSAAKPGGGGVGGGGLKAGVPGGGDAAGGGGLAVGGLGEPSGQQQVDPTSAQRDTPLLRDSEAQAKPFNRLMGGGDWPAGQRPAHLGE